MRRSALVLAALGAVTFSVVVLTTNEVAIPFEGRTVDVALPCRALVTDRTEGSATLLAFGDPALDRDLPGLRHLEQLGATSVYVGDSRRVLFTTQKRRRWLTELRVTVQPAAAP